MVIDKPIDVKFLSANQKRNLPLMVKSIIGENLEKEINPDLLDKLKGFIQLAQTRGIALIDYLIGFSTGHKTDYPD